jgi:hypothetical protein
MDEHAMPFTAGPKTVGAGSEPSKCPWCGGPADNGHDHSITPNTYLCSKCASSDRAKRNLEYNLLMEQ